MSSEAARTIGYNFLSAKIKGANSVADPQHLILEYVGISASGNKCLYVFNTPKGFVMVSGNDAVNPILAFSTESPFNRQHIPSNTAHLINTYVKQIDANFAANSEASSEVADKWSRLAGNTATHNTERTTSVVVGPLLGGLIWDQQPYYNDSCPPDPTAGDSLSVTGCVATATAQVMKYWHWPGGGTGSNSYTTATLSLSCSANFNHAFNWSAMPNSISAHNSNIAQLMWDVGVAVDMDYSYAESGAYVISSATGTPPYCAQYALTQFFYYDPNLIQGLYRPDYPSDATWFGFLTTELSASRPVIYAGSGSAGGHCWVLDGYDDTLSTNYFHCNWGWSGAGPNGYYSLDNMNPPALGTGGGGGGFDSSQMAIIGLQPYLRQIHGTLSVCPGGTTTLTDSMTYGSWSSGATAVATVSPAGVVTGIAGGTATISYTVSGYSVTKVVTVAPGVPTPTVTLSGSMPCSGATSAVYNASASGATSFNWSVSGTGWSGSSSTATITVNVGSGTGTIICSAAGSCGHSTPDTITVNSGGTPSAPVVTSPSAICVGSSGAFTASAIGATSYHWSVSGTGWSGSSTTGSLTATAGSGVGQLVVSGINSCGTGAATTVNVTPANVPALPSITTPGSVPCSGSASITCNATSSGASSFVWTVLGSGWSGSGSTSSVVVTVGSGTGMVICHGANSCGAGAADTVNMSPGTLPGAVIVTPPATLPCTGIVTYNAASSGATSFVWSVSGSGYSGSSSTSALSLTLGAGSGTIIVSGSNSCGNGPSDTVIVSHASLPSVPSIDLGSSLPCSGAISGTYIANSSGATSYVWGISGTGWSGSSTTATINVNYGAGSGTIICYGHNACGDGVADTVQISNPGFPATPALYLTSAIPCPSTGTATYFANSVGALGYSWAVYGTGWSATSTTTDSLTVAVGTGTAMIVCSGNNECGNSANDTAYLTPNALTGPASAILATTPVCKGGTATFITSSIANALNLVWVVVGTGWSGSSTTDMLTCTVGTGPGIITVYGAGICGSGSSYSLYDVVPATVPTASFSLGSHIVSAGVNDLVTYTGTPSTLGTYTWSFDGATASPGTGAGPNWVNWLSPGLKTISLTVNDSGCVSTAYSDTVLVVVPTSNNLLNSENASIRITPNPNNGDFKIVFANSVAGPVYISITDLAGRVIYQNEFSGVMDNKLEVNSMNIAVGTYLLHVSTGGGKVTEKISIVK